MTVTRTRAIDIAARAFAGLLFLVSLVAFGAAVRNGGGTHDLVVGLLSVYLTGALAVGVFRDRTDSRGWRIAFFGGFAVWAGYDYATGGGAFALLLLVVGVLMVAASVLGFE